LRCREGLLKKLSRNPARGREWEKLLIDLKEVKSEKGEKVNIAAFNRAIKRDIEADKAAGRPCVEPSPRGLSRRTTKRGRRDLGSSNHSARAFSGSILIAG
jgi:hypothetical protein